MSNPRDEMSRFVTGVADLVRKECYTVMLHDDMTLARLRVYCQSIEESKLRSMSRNLKRNSATDQGKPRSKKRPKTQ